MKRDDLMRALYEAFKPAEMVGFREDGTFGPLPLNPPPTYEQFAREQTYTPPRVFKRRIKPQRRR